MCKWIDKLNDWGHDMVVFFIRPLPPGSVIWIILFTGIVGLAAFWYVVITNLYEGDEEEVIWTVLEAEPSTGLESRCGLKTGWCGLEVRTNTTAQIHICASLAN